MNKYNDQIMVNRRGHTTDAYMKTEKIIGEVSKEYNYIITKDSLYATYRGNKYLDIKPVTPPYIVIDAKWEQSEDEKDDESNILGSIGDLKINISEIEIPIIDPSPGYLSFYGARIFDQYDIIYFDTPVSLPVTIMEIGEKYIDDYIMSPQHANGVYLEYHDLPHFHMPLNKDARGHLILGKKMSDNKYALSAFQIPHGKSIYTEPGVIHNDCFLIGKYIVVYSVTEKYSTVRLINDKMPVKINLKN